MGAGSVRRHFQEGGGTGDVCCSILLGMAWTRRND